MQRLAARLHVIYTRYADDLTFSGDKLPTLLSILGTAPKIVVMPARSKPP